MALGFLTAAGTTTFGMLASPYDTETADREFKGPDAVFHWLFSQS